MNTFARIGLVVLAAGMLSLASCKSKKGASPYADTQYQQTQQNPYASYGASQPYQGGYPNQNDYVDVQPVSQPQTSVTDYTTSPYASGNPYGSGAAYSPQPAPYVPPAPAPSGPTTYAPAPAPAPQAYAPPAPRPTRPVSAYQGTYTVVRGDTLYSIGRRHQSSAEAIKRANNLNSDLIFPGDQLLIP